MVLSIIKSLPKKSRNGQLYKLSLVTIVFFILICVSCIYCKQKSDKNNEFLWDIKHPLAWGAVGFPSFLVVLSLITFIHHRCSTEFLNCEIGSPEIVTKLESTYDKIDHVTVKREFLKEVSDCFIDKLKIVLIPIHNSLNNQQQNKYSYKRTQFLVENVNKLTDKIRHITNETITFHTSVLRNNNIHSETCTLPLNKISYITEIRIHYKDGNQCRISLKKDDKIQANVLEERSTSTANEIEQLGFASNDITQDDTTKNPGISTINQLKVTPDNTVNHFLHKLSLLHKSEDGSISTSKLEGVKTVSLLNTDYSIVRHTFN